jgi:cell division protein FtsL
MEIIAIVIAVALIGLFVYTYRDTTNTTPKVVDTKSGVVADANDNGVISKAELNKLTKVQLFDLAEKKTLKVKKSGTKAAVVNEIWSQLR